jgi:hypothetical protein
VIREQIFTNHGSIYKEVRIYETPKKVTYQYDENLDPVWPFCKTVGKGKKFYSSSNKLRKVLNVTSDYPTADFSSFDICPAIDFLAGVATYDKEFLKEMFFAVKNKKQIEDIANYYDLEVPLSDEQFKTLEETPEQISSYWDDSQELVIASIRFNANVPILFKVYFIYKHHEKWDLMNRGRVFCEGKVIEKGGWFIHKTRGSKFESSSDTNKTIYSYGKDPFEPLANWKAEITDVKTNAVTVKRFESSKMVRKAICNMTEGPEYENYNKAPQVTWWLGRSWVEDSTEEELYFHVESKEMLDSVCSYYKLPVPYNNDLRNILENNIKSIRFKSYDLLRLGEGSFVELVVASVVFIKGTPTAIKLYETKRPNE